MVELLGIVVTIACFAFAFALVYLLGQGLMTAGDLALLVLSLLALGYLLYALFRGETL